MVRIFEPPVYCYHEIVHNRLVVDRFQRARRDLRRRHRRGARPARRSCSRPTARRPRSWPPPGPRTGFVVNAVCPLVTKVHHEAKVRADKGYTILYVGHAGHDEAVGTLAVAPDVDPPGRARGGRRPVVATVADPPKVALLAQTTLSLHDWQGITDRGPRAVPRAVDRGPQRPVLRHHQPPGRAVGDRGRGRRRRRDRQRQLVEHHRPGQGGRRPRGARSCCASTAPRSSTRRARRRRDRRRHRRAPARPEDLVQAVIAAPRARPTASSWCTSPTRTSTSLPHASCGSCWHARRSRRRCVRRDALPLARRRRCRRSGRCRFTDDRRRRRLRTSCPASSPKRSAQLAGEALGVVEEAWSSVCSSSVSDEVAALRARPSAPAGRSARPPTTATWWSRGSFLPFGEDLLAARRCRPARSAPRASPRGRPVPSNSSAISAPVLAGALGEHRDRLARLQHRSRSARRPRARRATRRPGRRRAR